MWPSYLLCGIPQSSVFKESERMLFSKIFVLLYLLWKIVTYHSNKKHSVSNYTYLEQTFCFNISKIHLVILHHMYKTLEGNCRTRYHLNSKNYLCDIFQILVQCRNVTFCVLFHTSDFTGVPSNMVLTD